jgi:hypothetical protein
VHGTVLGIATSVPLPCVRADRIYPLVL